MKLILPKNWDIVSETINFIPNSVVAGSIVDKIHLSDNGSFSGVFKDIDLEIDKQDYKLLLAKCGIPYEEGNFASEISYQDLHLKLVKFDLHPEVKIYIGTYKKMAIDLFILENKRASQESIINGFNIRYQTVESRQEVIDKIINISPVRSRYKLMENLWLSQKKMSLSKKKKVLDAKFKK